MKAQKGFSLIELLIVVAIILVIAAIAIPNFLKARAAANEASAVGALRSLHTGLVTYATTYAIAGFPANLDQLSPGNTCDDAGLLDPVMTTGNTFTKSGYTFTYAIVGGGGTCAGPPGNDYTVNADPTVPNKTGIRYFFVDSSGVIRQNIGGPADASSLPVPG